MHVQNPVISFAMIVAILNLAAPLDYHLIFGAGIYTAVYIAARAAGKYLGAWSGRPRHPRPENSPAVLGLHPAAPLRRFPGLYWHRRVRAGGKRSGLRRAYSGDHRRSGGYQRDHCRIYGQEGL